MNISPIYSFTNRNYDIKKFNESPIQPQTQDKLVKNSINPQINFCAQLAQIDFLKSMKVLMEKESCSAEVFENIFRQMAPEKQENIMKVVKHFEKYGIQRNDIIKKMLAIPSIYAAPADKIINHTNAYVFIERQKSSKTIDELIPYVIDKKNLALKNDSVYAPFLVSRIFKESDKPDCFINKCHPVRTLKRYLRKNPDAKLDTIKILDDKMAPDFIDFAKTLSKEISGHENLFKIEIIKPETIKKPVLITDSKENPTIVETIKDMRTLLADSGKINNDIMNIYKKLPIKSRNNLTRIIKILRDSGEEISPPTLMKAGIKYPLFFQKESADSVKLLKAKRFALRDAGNVNATINSALEGAFNEYHPSAIYSRVLADKLFANKSQRPWYLNVRAKDLTEEIGIYLQEHRGKKINIDVIEDEMTDNFIAYAKGLSNRYAGINWFDFNVIKK